MGWKFWAGLLISSLFLYFAFHNIDLTLFYNSIKSTKMYLAIPVALLTIILYLIRALRWFHLLEPIKKIGLSSLFSSTVIGFAANCVLPARLGEFIRANHLGRMENISKSSSFATIVTERLFDIFAILLISLFVVLSIDFPLEWASVETAVKTGGILMLIFFVISILLLIMLKERTQAFIIITEKLTFFLPSRIKQKIIDILNNFSKGLVLIKGPYQLLAVIFYSFILWGLTVFQVYVIGLSLDMSLPFLAPFLILVLLCFSVTIPSAPGYIGTFHLACQYGLVFYGFSHEKALSMAIVLHAAGVIPTVILGLMIFLLQHISLSNYVNRTFLLKK